MSRTPVATRTEVINEAVSSVVEELTQERMTSLSIARYQPFDQRTRDYHAARVAVLGTLLDSMDEPGFDPTPKDLKEAVR